MNIASLSAHTATGYNRKRTRIPIRSVNKSGPGSKTSINELPPNLQAALHTRLFLAFADFGQSGEEDTTVDHF